MSNLFPSIGGKEKELDKPVQHLFHTIEYELEGIVNKIKNINSFDQREIKDIIIRQHSMILNYDNFLSSNSKRELALSLFTDRKFLSCFLDVIRLLELTNHEKICMNKIAYDYYRLDIKDEEISTLLYQLTTEVNSKEVLALSGIIGIADARILAMIRNSSFKEEKVVHRINAFLVKYNKVELSLVQIVNIYCYLFNRITALFVQTMMEPKPSNLLPYEEKNFDKISIAMLELLNSMPSGQIKLVLQSYAHTLSLIQVNTTVRFAIKTAVQYDRIIRLVKEVEIESALLYNNVKIP